jgi:hypothetical protein
MCASSSREREREGEERVRRANEGRKTKREGKR